MAQTRNEIFGELRKQSVEAIKVAGQVDSGLQSFTQMSIGEFLRFVAELEATLPQAQELSDDDLRKLRGKYIYMSSFLTGMDGLLQTIDGLISQLETQRVVVVPSVEASPAVEIEDRPRVEYLARFIHDVRFHFPDFLQAEGLGGVDGDHPETFGPLVDALKKMEQDIGFRVGIERQFFLLFHSWFGRWMDDSFARIGGLTTKTTDSYPMPKDQPPGKPFISVTHDSENKPVETFEGILDRFPKQFTKLNELLKLQLKAKLGTYSTAVSYASSQKSRATIQDYVTFMGADSQKNQFDGFRWRYNLSDEGNDGLEDLIPSGVTGNEKLQELQELRKEFIQGDLIRLAMAMIDSIGFNSGKEPGVKAKDLDFILFSQVIEQVSRLYAEYHYGVGANIDRLTTLEKKFIHECVQWAFIYNRNLGLDAAMDPNAVDHEISQPMRSVEYHWIGQKNVEGTGHKEYSIETGRILARAVLPLAEHVFGLVRIPKDGVELASSRQFFQALEKKYGDKWYLSNEWLNALGMLPHTMVDKASRQMLWDEIDKHFVAVRLDPKYQVMGYGEFGKTGNPEGFIFIPKTHVIGDKSDPRTKFIGLHLSFSDILRLRVRYFDEKLTEEEQGKDHAGRLILMSSFPDSLTPYATYVTNSTKLYEVSIVGKAEVLKNIKDVKVTMVRYPSDDILEHLITIPMNQRIDYIRRSLPLKGVATTKDTFDYHRDVEAREHRVNHHFDVATSSPIGQDQYNAMGLSGLFSSTIKYVIDNTISNNARRGLNPMTGEPVVGENPKSLQALRKMYRDILQVDHPNFDRQAVALPFPVSLDKLIEEFEQSSSKDARKDLQLAIRIEIFFLILSLYLSKYRPIPQPSDAKLQDYHKLEIRTYGMEREALGPEEIKKIRSIIASFITTRMYAENDDVFVSSGSRTEFMSRYGYDEAGLLKKIDQLLEYYGITKSFEAGVLLLQYEMSGLEKLPMITDLHKKPTPEKK